MKSSEYGIPLRETTHWRSNPYDRLRTLYPPDAEPQVLRDIAENEAHKLYVYTSFGGQLGGFAYLYGPAVTASLDSQGYELDEDMGKHLSEACRNGSFVSMDLNAHALDEIDRARLYEEEILYELGDNAGSGTLVAYNSRLAGAVLDMAEEIEQRGTTLVPYEILLLADAMYADSNPTLREQQIRAFAIGASVVYDHLLAATYPRQEELEAA